MTGCDQYWFCPTCWTTMESAGFTSPPVCVAHGPLRLGNHFITDLIGRITEADPSVLTVRGPYREVGDS